MTVGPDRKAHKLSGKAQGDALRTRIIVQPLRPQWDRGGLFLWILKEWGE